jgi:hypothetical protein
MGNFHEVMKFNHSFFKLNHFISDYVVYGTSVMHIVCEGPKLDDEWFQSVMSAYCQCDSIRQHK